MPGTSGDDTIIAGLAGDNGARATLTAGDSVDGGAGTDRIELYGNVNASAFAAANVKSVEQVYAQFDAGASTLNVSGNTDVKEVWVAKGDLGGGATVTLNKAQVAGIAGAVTNNTSPTAPATLNFTFKDATASTADAATLALNGAALASGDTLEVDAVETLTVNVDGKNNVRNLSADSITSLIVTGAGSFAAVAADTAGDPGYQGGTYKTIDASKNSGGVTIDISAVTGQDVAINGGSGNDEIILTAAALNKKDTIDLGEGNDTLTFTDTATFNTEVLAENLSKVSNVETLKVVGATLTVDADLVKQSDFAADENNAALVISDAVSNSTVTFLDGDFAASSVAMKLGQNTLNIVLTGDATDEANVVGTGTVGDGLVVTGSSTLNISSAGQAGVVANVLDLKAADNQAVSITGAKDLNLVATAATGTTGFSIDASAFTGKLDVTGTAAADIIKGGSGADTIRAFGSGVDTLTGNGGADTFVVFGDDDDIGFTAGSPAGFDATAVSVTDIITDFVSGTDKLAGAVAASTTNYVESTAVSATLSAFITAADTALNGTVKYFVGQVGNDSYVAFDDNGDGLTALIQLTGVSLDGIAQADIVALAV